MNPSDIIKEGILIPVDTTRIQQNGIDCSLQDNVLIKHLTSANVELREYVNLPYNVFAIWCNRSTLNRRGIMTHTGLWDSGYHGYVGCTIYNMSGKDVTLRKGDRVGQIVFLKGNSASMYNGQYGDK